MAHITLDEFCEQFQVEIDFDPSKWCHYLYDPVEDDDLSPCMMNLKDLEKWLNDPENWEEILEKIQKREEMPEEYDRVAA